jgi:hypothetical protein
MVALEKPEIQAGLARYFSLILPQVLPIFMFGEKKRGFPDIPY